MDDDSQHFSDLVSVLQNQSTSLPQLDQMSEQTLLALIGQRLSASHQWYGTGKLASQRMKADQYYRGDPLGNEVDGRSQVVSRDVAEAVDSMMPSLIRVFTSGEQVVVMEPSRPDAEEASKQATDYLNWVFLQQNEGFQVIYNFLKDGLLKRNGIAMAWYETRISRQKSEYTGLTEGQYRTLLSDGSIEVLKFNKYPDTSVPPQQPQPQINPMTGMPMQDPMTGQMVMQPPPPPPMLYDCTIMSSKPEKNLVVQNVPPDEFVIERRASSLDTANYMARRRKMVISDLLELEYPRELVMSIPVGSDIEYTQERIKRFQDEDELPYGTDGENLDKTMRKVWVTESYIRVDFDGDGIAEWRKVTTAGDSAEAGIILDNEEIDDHPFAAWTPIPDPHRFYGYSIYDQTHDIQDIKTALMRGSLDSIYLANSPRLGFLEGQANVDDLLDNRVGGLVRLKNPNAIIPIPSVNAAPQAFEMIGYMDQVREKRTGVATASAGLDPNILNSSATGANILNNNNQQRLELIARVCAETGIKRLFRRMFQLICMHEDKAKTIRLRGTWVDIDPRDWKDRMDVTVSVGVGLGDRVEKMNSAMMMLNLDQKIFQMQGGLEGPFLTPQNIYNKLEKVVEAAGWKSVQPYYTDPKTLPPPKPKGPTPDQQHEMAMAERQAQLEQLKSQTTLTKTQMDNQTDITVAQIQASSKLYDQPSETESLKG